MMIWLRTALFALAGAFWLSGAAHAFDSSSGAPASYLTVEEAARFSKQIERDLAAKGARLAMVFRTGRPRDKLPQGIAYTHGAIWAYRNITTADGRALRGYAVYNLYHGDGERMPRTQSYLHQDWPLDFTRGTAVDDVAIIIPSPEMQRRMLAILDSDVYASLHNPSYSLIANPLEAKHQNCNGFMLDVIAAASWNTTDRDQIRANLRAHFTPTPINVAGYQRVFGPIVDGRLKTDDQGRRLVTATYESMSAFMRDNGLLQESYALVRAQ